MMDAWTPVHLAVIGLILMLGGLIALGQSIQGGHPGTGRGPRQLERPAF
jgi:hypothetical protein